MEKYNMANKVYKTEVDCKDWTGLHANGGRKKPGANGSKPHRKTQIAVERRAENWEKTDSGRRGRKPGSQNPHKVRGK